MFDAYTVKKVLPRLVIAAILIQLSYEIFVLLIDIINQIAFGIEGFMYAPFGGKDVLTFANLISNSDAGAGESAGFFTSIAIGGGLALGTLGVLSLAGTAFIALFIGYVVLVLRQAIIVALVVISPIALVAWILPNTEKVWKIWWDSFFKLLLMYPLVLLMIAAGRVFAAIYVTASKGEFDTNIGTPIGSLINDFASFIIVVIAYFGPFFLIPATFKVAGSAFANLSGMANDRSRGVFDRLKKGRQERVAKNVEAIKTGNRFAGGTDTNMRGRLNRGLSGAANIGQAGFDPRRMRGRMRTALDAQSEGLIEDYSKSAEFAPISADDAKLWAAKETDRNKMHQVLADRDEGRFAGDDKLQAREEAIEQIMRAKRATNTATFARARVRAQGATGTGYIQKTYQKDAAGNFVRDADGKRIVVSEDFDAFAAAKDVADAYGDSDAGAAIQALRSGLQSGGQMAGAAGYGDWAGLVAQARDKPNMTPTQKVDANNTLIDKAAESVSPQQAIYGKPSSAKALAQSHRRKIEAAAAVGDVKQVESLTAAAAGLLDTMYTASPQNADQYADELMAMPLNLPELSLPSAGGGSTVISGAYTGSLRNYVEEQTNNPGSNFKNRRSQVANATRDGLLDVRPGTGGLPPTPGGAPGKNF